jgi:hypothetical protein
MFVAVKTRLLRPLVYVLVAAQLLLSAPVVSAFAASKPASAMSAACASEMHVPGDASKCPCCPDMASMSACLATCTAAAAIMTAEPATTSPVVASAIAAAPVAALVSLSDPPLKPPPIV